MLAGPIGFKASGALWLYGSFSLLGQPHEGEGCERGGGRLEGMAGHQGELKDSLLALPGTARGLRALLLRV